MLIVCTKDPAVVANAQRPGSGAAAWGTLVILDPRYNQAQATAAIDRALRQVGAGEPLCFYAHGNDYEIGDPGSGRNDWGWDRAEIAALLQNAMPAGYCAPILIQACAENVSNFSAGLAVALERIRALNRVWIYGYQRAVPVDHPLPNPRTLDSNRELYATQVNYFAEAQAPAAELPAGDDAEPVTASNGHAHASNGHASLASVVERYRASFPSGHMVDVPPGFNPDELRRLLGLLAETSLR